MRTIDADELMEHVWRDKLDSRELIAKMIDDAPTVPASCNDPLLQMSNLCDEYNIRFEVTGVGVNIVKYICFCGNPYRFKQTFSFDTLKHKTLKDCVLEFERQLELSLDKHKSDKMCYISNAVAELSRALAEESEVKNDKI